jgi:methyl-accepting chemotaxis protein
MSTARETPAARRFVGTCIVGLCAVAGVVALAAFGAEPALQRRGAMALGLLALASGIYAARGLRRHALQPLDAAAALAGQMASGDLSGAAEDAVAARHPLTAALDALRGQTFGIVADVRSRTLAIATSSGHIGADQAAFSSAVRTQANSLESTASSLEELTAAVQHNADNAARGHELATSTLALASQGGEVVQQVVDTMGTIRGSSNKIVDIIGVIDGIAFQTNILALNAAVEAARAGEQGRGFAVVASEVRSLATRSAEAAKAVKGLIDNSVSAVNSGAALVERAGATMHDIVGSVQRVTEIMTEMSAAARQQSAGIAEVNRAIGEIDAATQRNAALIERAGEPVRALHEQAVGLTDAVAFFKLGEREFASDADAHALVHKGAQFIRSRGAKALIDEVNKLDKGELIDRDLYLSVYSPDARCVAHGVNSRLAGIDASNFKDLDGKMFVSEIVSTAKRDGKGHVSYRWMHPLTQKAMVKSTYFERHGDLILACGAYA